ncbi:hypothetical protein BGW38_008536, partial [Lunasporangiospora selenospora]
MGNAPQPQQQQRLPGSRQHRSKSLQTGLKIDTRREEEEEPLQRTEGKSKSSSTKRPLTRSYSHYSTKSVASFSTPLAPPLSAPLLSLSMSGHQHMTVKCGHCSQERVLMPLCVCKKVRYCNRDCRLADLANHRTTGCNAALIAMAAAAAASATANAAVAAATVTSSLGEGNVVEPATTMA